MLIIEKNAVERLGFSPATSEYVAYRITGIITNAKMNWGALGYLIENNYKRTDSDASDQVEIDKLYDKTIAFVKKMRDVLKSGV